MTTRKATANNSNGGSFAVSDSFRRVASAISRAFGSPWALATALSLVVVWAVTGPYFNFSDAWQLVINTGTTIVTFLMAFLIQATQYRESQALQLKIDELLRAAAGARTGFVNVENLSDEELERLAAELHKAGDAERLGAALDKAVGERSPAGRKKR